MVSLRFFCDAQRRTDSCASRRLLVRRREPSHGHEKMSPITKRSSFDWHRIVICVNDLMVGIFSAFGQDYLRAPSSSNTVHSVSAASSRWAACCVRSRRHGAAVCICRVVKTMSVCAYGEDDGVGRGLRILGVLGCASRGCQVAQPKGVDLRNLESGDSSAPLGGPSSRVWLLPRLLTH